MTAGMLLSCVCHVLVAALVLWQAVESRRLAKLLRSQPRVQMTTVAREDAAAWLASARPPATKRKDWAS